MIDPMLLPNVREDFLDVPTIERLTPTERATHSPRILLLYGSLRKRSYSKLLALEAARLLQAMGAAQTDRSVRAIMTPRRDLEILDLSRGPAAARTLAQRTRHSRLPVQDGGADDIVGVVAITSVQAQMAAEK